MEVKAKDVSGKPIVIGSIVAFCAAGKSSLMHMGKVIKLTHKTATVEYWKPRHVWGAESAHEIAEARRAHDVLCLVE